jgi:hypothetical protein
VTVYVTGSPATWPELTDSVSEPLASEDAGAARIPSALPAVPNDSSTDTAAQALPHTIVLRSALNGSLHLPARRVDHADAIDPADPQLSLAPESASPALFIDLLRAHR